MDELIQIAQHCPLLEDFAVTRGSCTDAFVLELSKHCKSLKRFDLMCPNLEEGSLLALVRSNPGLVSFTTSAYYGATEHLLRELALTCHGLTKLSLKSFRLSVTLATVCFVLSRCPNLVSVHLDSCVFVNPDIMAPNSAAVVSMSTSMRNLTIYNVTIKTEQLDCLLRLCPGLTGLQLSFCKVLIGLEEMPIGTFCPSLEVLVINGNTGAAGDELLLDLSAHCPHLRLLRIPEGYFESGNAVATLARRCALLEELDLSDSGGVTDDCLCALAVFAVHLKFLDLWGCDQITDVGVTAVMEGCVRLVGLDVRKCKKVSEQMQTAVGERYL
jgi:hypothetical protein